MRRDSSITAQQSALHLRRDEQETYLT